MNKFEITSRGGETRVFYFNEIKELDIFRTDQWEEYKREDFTVHVNMLQKLPFWFNLEEKCFYLDVEDIEANQAQLEKLTELTEKLDDTKPKDKEKIKKIFEENFIQFVVRQKVALRFGEFGKQKDLGEVVADFITDNNV